MMVVTRDAGELEEGLELEKSPTSLWPSDEGTINTNPSTNGDAELQTWSQKCNSCMLEAFAYEEYTIDAFFIQ